MPNGLPVRPSQPAFMPPQMPMQPMAQPQQSRRLPPELESFRTSVASEVSEFSARVRLLEQKSDNLRRHLELLDSSLIEKHKTVITEMRDVQDGMRSLRADIEFVKDLSERLAKRMEAMASREEVKVLQRYVEYWQPLSFVTRSEVKALVENILKEHGVRITS